ncbi:hypothetical protein Tco_1099546 [Tanacetum coccineum]
MRGYELTEIRRDDQEITKARNGESPPQARHHYGAAVVAVVATAGSAAATAVKPSGWEQQGTPRGCAATARHHMVMGCHGIVVAGGGGVGAIGCFRRWCMRRCGRFALKKGRDGVKILAGKDGGSPEKSAGEDGGSPEKSAGKVFRRRVTVLLTRGACRKLKERGEDFEWCVKNFWLTNEKYS